MQGQALTVTFVSQEVGSLSKSQEPDPCTASEDEDGAGVGGTGEGKPREERKETHAVVQLGLLYVHSNRIPLSLSALDKVELRFLLLQVKPSLSASECNKEQCSITL